MSAPNQRLEQFKDYQHKNELLSTKYWRRANGLDRGANERLLGGYVQRWMYLVLWCFPKLWNYFFPVSQEQLELSKKAEFVSEIYDSLKSNAKSKSLEELINDTQFKSLPDDLQQVINTLIQHKKNLANGLPLGINKASAREYLTKYLSSGQLSRLVKTGNSSNLFREILGDRKLERLLQAVVYGNENEAKNILEKSPHFLLKSTATVIDYSDKTIIGLTPFQAALCAGDVEMCEMMRPYFEKLDNGLEEMQRQYDEIFPSGIATHTQKQKEDAYKFDWIFEKIKNATAEQITDALDCTGASFTRTDKYNETDTKGLTKEQLDNLTLVEALNRFREEFDKLSKSEKIFNPYHLSEALELYSNKFNEFTNWAQRDVFWRQVTGYCQRNLPACYAQATAQGLYYITHENEPVERTLNFRGYNEAFYPIFVRGCSGLGFNWAVGGCPPVGRRRAVIGDAAGIAWRCWGRLCQTKTSGLEHLRISINTQNKVLLNYL